MKTRRALVAGVALAAASCRRAPKPLERTEPWLASASVSASASASPLVRRLHYGLTRTRVTFELPAKKATPSGKLLAAHGELDVDLDDLSHTTGSVTFDLSALELDGADGNADASYTAQGLAWLGLGAEVEPEARDVARAATVALTSLDAGHVVSAPNGDRRVARRELMSNWRVRGELSLHGVRAPLSADVSLTLVPGVDPAGPPAELVIRTRRPVVVSLGIHDIRPRNDRGTPIAQQLEWLGEKVGNQAKVSAELTFTPKP